MWEHYKRGETVSIYCQADFHPDTMLALNYAIGEHLSASFGFAKGESLLCQNKAEEKHKLSEC